VTFLTSRPDAAVQIGAMTTIAGVEVGRGPMAEPGGSDGIGAGDAECRRNLQNRRMGGIGNVTGFAAGRQPAQHNVEAWITAGAAIRVIGMAGLAEGDVGLGRSTVLRRIGPSDRVSQYAVTEGAVETAGSTGHIAGEDRRSKVGSPEMTLGADLGVQSLGIINRARVGGIG